jgi:hypothetical protein
MTSSKWAILLCKFNDNASEPQLRSYYEQLFTKTGNGSLNMVDFYNDATHGQMDLGDSQVFGWYTLDQKRSDYKGSGPNPQGRQDLVNWARTKASAAGVNLAQFFGVVVYMNVGTDLFGSPNQMVCDLNSVPSQIAQEMGHGYGLQHSRQQGSTNDYQDPWDVMSTMNAYQATNPKWANVGPGMNAANMASKSWLDPSRIWQGGGLVDLRPLHRRDLPGWLAVHAGDLHIEYRSKEKWDAAIPFPVVLVHRFSSDGHSYVLPDSHGSFGLQKDAHLEYGDLTLVNGAWTSVDVLGANDNTKTAQVQVKTFAQGQRDRYAAIWDQLNGPPWRAVHDLTATQYQQAFDQDVAQGFRPVWVSGYGVIGQDRYAAIFEQRQSPAWQARHGLTAAQYQQTFDQLTSQGYRPTCVSGYTVNGQDRYAAIFEQGQSPAWQARHGLTSAQYQQTFDQLVAQGYRPTCVSGYAVNGQDRYAAIFEQRQSVPWQARHGLTAAQYQQTFDQLAAQGYRPVDVSGYEVNNQDFYAAIFEQRQSVAWVARHGLTAAQYQQQFDQLSAQGYRPTCVSGYGPDR